jgi:hypothetical protein
MSFAPIAEYPIQEQGGEAEMAAHTTPWLVRIQDVLGTKGPKFCPNFAYISPSAFVFADATTLT